MEQIDLTDFFTTKGQATDFSTRLSEITHRIYSTDFNLESALLAEFGVSKKDKFMSLIRQSHINYENNSALQEFITHLQEAISAFPVISLTLAFEPDAATLYDLSQWFTLNIHRQVLLDIQVNPGLVAGATLTFNGKYLDFSKKAQFDQILSSLIAH